MNLREELEAIIGTRRDILDAPFGTPQEKVQVLDTYDRSMERLMGLFKDWADYVIGNNEYKKDELGTGEATKLQQLRNDLRQEQRARAQSTENV